MVQWLFQADRRLTRHEQDSQPIDRTCLACGGYLLRLAERERARPYKWVPCGYVCGGCNAVYLQVGR